jgi:hypothetical protein
VAHTGTWLYLALSRGDLKPFPQAFAVEEAKHIVRYMSVEMKPAEASVAYFEGLLAR